MRQKTPSRPSYRGTYAGQVAYRISSRATSSDETKGDLLRQMGWIIGAGLFVGIGIGAGVAGMALVPAIVLAAVVAACNELSTTRLASAQSRIGSWPDGRDPLAGSLTFAGGLTLLCAQAAAAATAALGLAGHLLIALNSDGIWHIPVALSAIAILALPVLGGLQRPPRFGAIFATTVLAVVATLCVVGLYGMVGGVVDGAAVLSLEGWAATGLQSFFHASALMLVAFAGLGSGTAREPSSEHPDRGVVPVVLVATIVYLVVAVVGLSAVGPQEMAQATASSAAPLVHVATVLAIPAVSSAVAIGAVIAMAGMLWNLLFGIARSLEVVASPQTSNSDLLTPDGPRQSRAAPAAAVAALIVAGLALLRDVHATWSLAALALTMSYTLFSLTALRLPPGTRHCHGLPVAVGSICLIMMFSLRPPYWQLGLGLVGLSFAWHYFSHRSRPAALGGSGDAAHRRVVRHTEEV